MRILHVIPSIDPKGGGPIEGLTKIGIELTRLGHSQEIVCLDDPSEPFVAAHPRKVYALGPSSLGGYRYNRKLVPWLRANRSNYDAVIVNGLWQFHGLAAWRALAGTGIPYFVFTHGMLDPWFKRTYPLKHLKKWLYWPWAEYRLLRDARAVLFTSEEERRLARESFWLYRCNEIVTAYGTSSPPAYDPSAAELLLSRHPELRGKRIVLFLSRIHEKKGCDLLVHAFAQVCATYPTLHLVIAGPDQTGWQARLQDQAKALGISDRVTWPGMLHGEAKWAAFYAAEVFCLPSHQENFGIVVAESLGSGTPVLISDKVNIWREIADDRAGIVNSDTPQGTLAGLIEWLGMPPAARQAMATAARACFERRYRIEQVADDLLGIVSATLPEKPKD